MISSDHEGSLYSKEWYYYLKMLHLEETTQSFNSNLCMQVHVLLYVRF